MYSIISLHVWHRMTNQQTNAWHQAMCSRTRTGTKACTVTATATATAINPYSITAFVAWPAWPVAHHIPARVSDQTLTSITA
jgi:hypothetical protein